jgi:hypothetical protein
VLKQNHLLPDLILENAWMFELVVTVWKINSVRIFNDLEGYLLIGHAEWSSIPRLDVSLLPLAI